MVEIARHSPATPSAHVHVDSATPEMLPRAGAGECNRDKPGCPREQIHTAGSQKWTQQTPQPQSSERLSRPANVARWWKRKSESTEEPWEACSGREPRLRLQRAQDRKRPKLLETQVELGWRFEIEARDQGRVARTLPSVSSGHALSALRLAVQLSWR